MMEWLPEFALDHTEQQSINAGSAARALRNAAQRVYQTDSSKNAGVRRTPPAHRGPASTRKANVAPQARPCCARPREVGERDHTGQEAATERHRSGSQGGGTVASGLQFFFILCASGLPVGFSTCPGCFSSGRLARSAVERACRSTAAEGPSWRPYCLRHLALI